MTAAACALLAVLSIWDYPGRFPAHERLRAEFARASREGDSAKMLSVSRQGAELLPDDPTWAYNLACSLARTGKMSEALDRLDDAIDLGFRDADVIASDGDFRPVAKDARFAESVKRARDTRERPVLSGPMAVTDATGVVGETLALGEQNMLWDFDDGCFVARMSLAPGSQGGNAGDLYMNRDGNHSRIVVTNYPGLTEVKLDHVGRERHMDLDFPNIKFPYPVFGNCSRAFLHSAFWRSIPRAMMTGNQRNLRTMASLYLSNQIWVFPVNADFPPVGTNGDVFASVAPYWIATQGRSWSDRYYLQAALEASRSMDPETKRHVVGRGLLAPTIMTLIRKSLRGVDGEKGYLTEKAHPTCMPPNGLDLGRLRDLAAGLRPDGVPPVVKFHKVGSPVMGKPPCPEFTYITPFALAAVLRSPDEHRIFDFSFEGAEELAFRIVHDPAGAAKIVSQGGKSVRMALDRTKLSGTVRVDLAAFGRNKGTGWGAPTYASFSVLDVDAPYYDPLLVPKVEVK